ncbi:MAG TPA: nucleoside triphosphate pyrophosphohydrolase, partial [Clostridiales bacterium]|nr:nucleoside triphosphate pyrophosphohydrolase [Clostridiales bacterium]
MKFKEKDRYTFQDLIDILYILRGENGCPWDREQTHTSIRNNFIEEVYEAVEAIDTQNNALLREELGDVL